MLIKGVNTDKSNRGDALELEPADKFPFAVLRGLKTLNKPNEIMYVLDGAEKGVTMTKKSWMATGKPPGYKWEHHNTYLGEGEANIREIHYINGEEKVRAVKKRKFQVKFNDGLDMGQPDIKIEEFKLID